MVLCYPKSQNDSRILPTVNPWSCLWIGASGSHLVQKIFVWNLFLLQQSRTYERHNFKKQQQKHALKELIISRNWWSRWGGRRQILERYWQMNWEWVCGGDKSKLRLKCSYWDLAGFLKWTFPTCYVPLGQFPGMKFSAAEWLYPWPEGPWSSHHHSGHWSIYIYF